MRKQMCAAVLFGVVAAVSGLVGVAAAAPPPGYVAAGEAVSVAPDAETIPAPAVYAVHDLKKADTDSRIYVGAVGDPALNGQLIFITTFVDPAEGWKSFFVADVSTYRIVYESPTQVVLRVSIASMKDDGTVGTRVTHLAVDVPTAEGKTITVQPVRVAAPRQPARRKR
jgi:hypothetical protein